MKVFRLVSSHFIQLKTLAPKLTSRRRIDSSDHTVSPAVTSVHSISRALVNELELALKDLGTPPSLEDIELLSSQQLNRSVPIVLAAETEVSPPSLPRPLRTNVFQIKDVAEQIKIGNLFSIAAGKERPIFVYNAYKVKPRMFDMEAFINYLSIHVSQIFGKPYDVLINLSFLDTSNEWSATVIDLLEKILAATSKVKTQLQNVILLNVNPYANSFAKRIVKIIHSRSAKKILVVSSAQELADFMTPEVLLESLDGTTGKLLTGSIKIYTNVTRVIEKAMIPVVLNLSSDYLSIITSSPKIEVFGFHGGVIVENIKLESITSFGTTFPVPEDRVQCTLLYKKEGSVVTHELTIQWSSAFAIINGIRSNISQNAQKGLIVRRDMSIPNVLATMINVSLLNIANQDTTIRFTSYSLLCEVSKTLNFKRFPLVLNRGVTIPINTIPFVGLVSLAFSNDGQEFTLELISEWLRIFDTYGTLKTHAIRFLSHWIDKVELFISPSDGLSAAQPIGVSIEKIKLILNGFIALTVKETNVNGYFNHSFSMSSRLVYGISLHHKHC